MHCGGACVRQSLAAAVLAGADKAGVPEGDRWMQEGSSIIEVDSFGTFLLFSGKEEEMEVRERNRNVVRD